MSEGDQPDDSQKTEEPSAKKLEESRKKGQIPVSREVNTWLMLLAATVMIGTMAPGTMGSLQAVMKTYLEHAHDLPGAPGGMRIVLHDGFLEALKIIALPLVLLMLVGIIGPFGQVGPIFAPEVIKPDLSKISIIKGFERLFSKRSLIEFVKGILKLLVVSLVGVIILYPYFDKFEHMVGLPIPLLMKELSELVMQMMIGILIVLAVIAGVDLVYQRYEHYQKMRMTKQELKDEYKQSEGDPHIKGRLRQLRAERARQRMMQNVPKADVVITNPTHYSIALQYDSETMAAPKCVAKGVDLVALRIREIAKEHNVMLYENVPLARTLYDVVEVDETIPPEQYKAVAEVISFVFKAKGKLRR